VLVFEQMFVNEFGHTCVMMSVSGERAEEIMLCMAYTFVPTISARSVVNKLVNFGDCSFKVIGPRLWNSLPIHIKCSGTPSMLKQTLKT